MDQTGCVTFSSHEFSHTFVTQFTAGAHITALSSHINREMISYCTTLEQLPTHTIINIKYIIIDMYTKFMNLITVEPPINRHFVQRIPLINRYLS